MIWKNFKTEKPPKDGSKFISIGLTCEKSHTTTKCNDGIFSIDCKITWFNGEYWASKEGNKTFQIIKWSSIPNLLPEEHRQ